MGGVASPRRLVSRFRRSYHLAATAFTNVGNKGTLANMILVSRFRSSHHYAAHSLANFGIKGTLAIYDSSAVFGFEVPKQTRGYNDRNFKSTALVWLCI